MSFKQQMLKTREAVIVDTVSRLLAARGFEAMTMDEVAAQVGIAKASLYKHFSCKEDLVGAAMVRVTRLALSQLQSLPVPTPPIDKLRAVLRWFLAARLAGDLPALPSQNSAWWAALRANQDCRAGLAAVSECLLTWIEAAQAGGQLNPALPAVVILYAVYARACDPALVFLKLDGRYADDQTVALLLTICFEGLNAPARPGVASTACDHAISAVNAPGAPAPCSGTALP